MEQHVISAFLLRGFARVVDQRRTLTAFDKRSGTHVEIDVRDFLTESDTHPVEVEHDFNLVETKAARAIFELRKSMRAVAPGMYAVGSERLIEGDPIEDVGVHEGTRLYVTRHQVAGLPPAEQEALLRFVALMYQRAPGMEAAILEFGRAYDAAVRETLARYRPWYSVPLVTDRAGYRQRITARALDIAGKLRPANWWLVKTEPPSTFVLGDSPVVATISLGHDDKWRAILSSETYVVAMPLGPELALLMAPQLVMPVVVDAGLRSIVGAVNRLSWRHAARYVVGCDAAALDAAWPPTVDADGRRATVSPPVDLEHLGSKASADTIGIVITTELRVAMVAGWLHWDRCRLVFGSVPYAADDRAYAGLPPCPSCGPSVVAATGGRRRSRLA